MRPRNGQRPSSVNPPNMSIQNGGIASFSCSENEAT